MKLLLDTHIWLWSLMEPTRLSKRTAKELVDTSNELWISPISTWEVVILVQKKKLKLRASAEEWIAAALAEIPFKEAPLTHEIAIASASVDVPHGDPADRFLAATARVYGLTLVTGDENLLRGTNYKLLANR